MTGESGNLFLELVRQAAQQNWCVRPHCTTCGAMYFRSALRAAGGELGGPLLEALANLDLDELMSLPDWDGALETAVGDLPLPGQAMTLLDSWLGRAEEYIRFFDVVLYRLVRHLPEDHPVRERWIARGISLALQTGNFSLVESLILTLRGNAVQHEELLDLARQLAARSQQMQRVLRNACNIETKSPQQWPRAQRG